MIPQQPWLSVEDPVRNIFAFNVSPKLRISVISVRIDAANLSLRISWKIWRWSSAVRLVKLARRRYSHCRTFKNIMKSAHLLLSQSSTESDFNHNTNAKTITNSNFSLETSNKWLLLFVPNANNKSYAVQSAVNATRCTVSNAECLLAQNSAAQLDTVLNVLKIWIFSISVMSVVWMLLSSILQFMMIRAVILEYVNAVLLCYLIGRRMLGWRIIKTNVYVDNC